MQERGAHIGLIVLSVIIGLLCLLVFFSVIFSYKQEHQSENNAFKFGSLPAEPLDGFYQGNPQSRTDWQGKVFDQSNHSGINKFGEATRYTFSTSTIKSLRSNQQVIRLNYNQPRNPWWLKYIVDEIVEMPPDSSGSAARKFQGKVFVKIGPFVWTLTYFQLTSTT
jgi:hypothetical protein